MSKARLIPCPRCGQKRPKTRPTAILCADCRYVLPRNERLQWEPIPERKKAA